MNDKIITSDSLKAKLKNYLDVINELKLEFVKNQTFFTTLVETYFDALGLDNKEWILDKDLNFVKKKTIEPDSK